MKIYKVKKIVERNGKIFIFEKSKKIKFKIKRVFLVKSNKSKIRGKHAHKKCIQLLNCISGSIEINCETIQGKTYNFLLDKPDKYLILPKLTWCIQKYKLNNSVLMVICSEKFSESDYIRSYKKFKSLQK